MLPQSLNTEGVADSGQYVASLVRVMVVAVGIGSESAISVDESTARRTDLRAVTSIASADFDMSLHGRRVGDGQGRGHHHEAEWQHGYSVTWP